MREFNSMSPGTSKSTTVEGPGTHQKTRKVTPYKSTFCSNINISHLGVYLKKGKTLIGKDTCTMCTEALFTVFKVCKQSNYSSTDKWIRMWCIHNGILLSHKKE